MSVWNQRCLEYACELFEILHSDNWSELKNLAQNNSEESCFVIK